MRNARELTKSKNPYIQSFPGRFCPSQDAKLYVPEPLVALAATTVIQIVLRDTSPTHSLTLRLQVHAALEDYQKGTLASGNEKKKFEAGSFETVYRDHLESLKLLKDAQPADTWQKLLQKIYKLALCVQLLSASLLSVVVAESRAKLSSNSVSEDASKKPAPREGEMVQIVINLD